MHHYLKVLNGLKVRVNTERSRSIDINAFFYYLLAAMKQKFIFIALFSLISFIGLQIPFTKLAGSNVSFTLFDFFAPISGAFLGPLYGVASVFLVEVVNFIIKGTTPSTGSIIRLFPILFACFYFGLFSKKTMQRNDLLILAIPILAIIAFTLHPIGREVWYYSLFWIIPLIAYFKKDNLFIRSLGATFAAHSIGGALWIWAFNLPANVWNSLIPIVIQERLLFALGIALSFIVFKHILSFLIARKVLPQMSNVLSKS